MYTLMFTYAYRYTRVSVHECMPTFAYVYAFVCVCVCVCVCARVMFVYVF